MPQIVTRIAARHIPRPSRPLMSDSSSISPIIVSSAGTKYHAFCGIRSCMQLVCST